MESGNEIKEKECLARRVCAQRYPPGCGIRLNEDERFDTSKWREQNILGFALMEVRSMFRKAG